MYCCYCAVVVTAAVLCRLLSCAWLRVTLCAACNLAQVLFFDEVFDEDMTPGSADEMHAWFGTYVFSAGTDDAIRVRTGIIRVRTVAIRLPIIAIRVPNRQSQSAVGSLQPFGSTSRPSR